MITSQDVVEAAKATQRAERTLVSALAEAESWRPIGLMSMNSKSNFFDTLQEMLNSPKSPLRDLCIETMKKNLQTKREIELSITIQRQKELQGILDDGQKKVRKYTMVEKVVYEGITIPDNIPEGAIEEYILNNGGSFVEERTVMETPS